MIKHSYHIFLSLILLSALVIQLAFFRDGVFRITSDESARILTAWHLSWSNAFEPFLWPPFYKLFVGSALKLYPAIFFTPRLLVCIVGLLTLLSLAALATQLFQNRQISLITVVLAVLAPHRLIFSVVPLSDIYYFLFMISAAAWAAQWIRTDRTRSLFLACGSLLLAESVRFESGLFAVFLEILLLYRCIIQRNLSFTILCGASSVLFVFPVLWVLNSCLWYGSLKNLGITSQQYIGENGRDTWLAIKSSPLRFFIQDILWNPLTLPGLALLAWLSMRDAMIRTWALLFGVPLFALSVFMVFTFSIPLAATWRTSGFWTLVILPFDAFVVLRVGTFLRRSIHVPPPALGVLLLVMILPMGVRSLWYARDGLHNNESHAMHQERALDTFLDARLSALPGAIAIVDSSTNLDYLDVLAFSAFPDRLTLTAEGDPVHIGIYVPMRAAYAGRPDAVSFLMDRFGLAHGGSAQALAPDRIRFLVVHNPAFIAALDRSPLVARLKQFNDWTVYSVMKNERSGKPRTVHNIKPGAGGAG